MFEFINYLKLMATLLITNSHFGDIWPVSAMASGGLLGNIIFFAVSGYLLFDIKENFPKWFGKRFMRVYPAMAVFTLFAVAVGQYSMNSLEKVFALFVYPTNYVFLVWLIVCYCIYYIIMFSEKKNGKTLENVMCVLLVVWLFVYIVFYDKSVYRVDNVSEPFILFLYLESMLLGAFFRKHNAQFRKFSFVKLAAAVLCFGVYLASKILVSKMPVLLNYQIVNQIVILITLYFTFALFMSLEQALKRVPSKLGDCVRYISNITLQIYIVQFVIIEHFEELVFPMNLAVVSILIVAAASVLYLGEYFVRKSIKNKEVTTNAKG